MEIHQSRNDSGASSGIPGKITQVSHLLKKMEGFSLELRIKQTYLDDSTNLYIPMKMSQTYLNLSGNPIHQ